MDLFISQQGVVACSKHGGFYLERLVEQDEKRGKTRFEYLTPLDSWFRLSTDAEPIKHVQCEECLAKEKQHMLEKIAQAHKEYIDAGYEWKSACTEYLIHRARQWPSVTRLEVTCSIDESYSEVMVEAFDEEGSMVWAAFEDLDMDEVAAVEGAVFGEGDHTTIIIPDEEDNDG